MNKAEKDDPFGWGDHEKLVGRVVIVWGRMMSCVYDIPRSLSMPEKKDRQRKLALMGGDGKRIKAVADWIAEIPPPSDADTIERLTLLSSSLPALLALVPRRDAIVHGLPVYSVAVDPKSLKRDPTTGKIDASGAREIRRGCYLVQTRETDETLKYLPLPDAAAAFISDLETVMDPIFEATAPISLEMMRDLFGERPR